VCGGWEVESGCAAERLRLIFLGINAKDHTLQISMPWHPIPPAQTAQTVADIAKLERQIDEHGVIFLLMDSRRSIWVLSVFLGRGVTEDRDEYCVGVRYVPRYGTWS